MLHNTCIFSESGLNSKVLFRSPQGIDHQLHLFLHPLKGLFFLFSKAFSKSQEKITEKLGKNNEIVREQDF